MSLETQDIERKVFSILKVLANSKEAMGSRIIARQLNNIGIDLNERSVRYHLKLTDEKGLTRLEGRREGRVITEQGQEELQRALVSDKVGFAFSRIEDLAFRSSFNIDKHQGTVPVNVSFFPKNVFKKALKIMRPVFQAGFCVSDRVAVAEGGEKIDGLMVPQDSVALVTVCSVTANGVLLKAGVPVDSRFGGILQIRKQRPLRFTELIHYSGSSLDPSEIFIRANMTSVTRAVEDGNGEILANFREIPGVCYQIVEDTVKKLKRAGFGGILLLGNISEPICEVSIDLNRAGIILVGGLNPVAAAQEAGIPSENHAMSVLIDYEKLVKISDI